MYNMINAIALDIKFFIFDKIATLGQILDTLHVLVVCMLLGNCTFWNLLTV